jgi:ribonuclease BN (tRNA processing enzyme)
MEVRILGAHNLESRRTRHTCLLIDCVLALDAGSLASALTPAEQARISAVLLSHSHFDHIRDIPTLGLATLSQPEAIEVYSLPQTLSAVHSNLLNWEIYPDKTEPINGNDPKFRFHSVEPAAEFPLLDYRVEAVPVPHTVPSVGFIVTSSSGASVAYTGDTQGGLKPFFQEPNQPQLLFVELTFPNRLKELAQLTGHLTPCMLGAELKAGLKSCVTPPRVVAVHLSVEHQPEITEEIAALSQEMEIEVEIGYEGMRLVV